MTLFVGHSSWDTIESYIFVIFLTCVMEHNPGSVKELVLTHEGRFKYCFPTLATSKGVYQYCRPIVCVDGPHLKGKYKWVMFTTVCNDNNNNIFSLAWGIGDVDNDSCGCSFSQSLRKCMVIIPIS